MLTSTSTCTLSNAVTGFGPDLADFTFKPCAVTNCVKCVDNYQICTECDQANGYILVNGSCDKKPLVIPATKILDNKFIQESQTWKMTFTQNVNVTEQCNILPIKIFDGDDGNTYSCDEIGCEIVDITSNGFSIRFNSQYSISYGTASLNRADCFSIKNFSEYPIEVNLKIIINKEEEKVKEKVKEKEKEEDYDERLRMFTSILSKLAQWVSLLTVMSMRGIDPTGVFRGFLLGCDVTKFIVLEGPEVKLPEYVLRIVDDLSRPMRIGNLLVNVFAKDPRCEVTDALARNNVECNIFSNYGEDVIVLFSILALNVILSSSCSFALTRLDKKHKKTRKVLAWIKNTYGLTFFICIFETSIFDIAFYSILHLIKSRATTSSVVGHMIAGSLIMMIFFFVCLQAYLARWLIVKARSESNNAALKPTRDIIERHSMQASRKKVDLKKTQKTIEEAVDFKAAPKWARPFTVLYADYRWPSKGHILCIGCSQSFKVVLQLIFIFAMNSSPSAQVCCVLMAEVAYFAHYLISNIKVSLSLRITEILTEVLMIVYLIFKLVTVFDGVSDSLRQGIISVIMVVSVYGIIVVSISFALFSLILILFQLCKRAILWCRSRCKKPSKMQPLNIVISIKNIKKSMICPSQSQKSLKNPPLGPHHDSPPSDKRFMLDSSVLGSASNMTAKSIARQASNRHRDTLLKRFRMINKVK